MIIDEALGRPRPQPDLDMETIFRQLADDYHASIRGLFDEDPGLSIET